MMFQAGALIEGRAALPRYQQTRRPPRPAQEQLRRSGRSATGRSCATAAKLLRLPPGAIGPSDGGEVKRFPARPGWRPQFNLPPWFPSCRRRHGRGCGSGTPTLRGCPSPRRCPSTRAAPRGRCRAIRAARPSWRQLPEHGKSDLHRPLNPPASALREHSELLFPAARDRERSIEIGRCNHRRTSAPRLWRMPANAEVLPYVVRQVSVWNSRSAASFQ